MAGNDGNGHDFVNPELRCRFTDWVWGAVAANIRGRKP